MFKFLILMLMDVAGSGAGGGTGAATGSGTGSVSTGASTPPQGSSGTPPTPTGGTGDDSQGQGQQQQQGQGQQQTDPNVNDPAYGNWKALRDQLEQTRAQAKGLEGQVAAYNKIRTDAATIAKELGFADQDFAEAFAADPIKTATILAQEKAARSSQQGQGQQRQGTDDLQQQIRDLVKQETAPMTEQVNRQITEAAMVKYESTLADTIKADPILSTAPAEIHELVKDYIGEYLSTQPEILAAMKMKGDYSSVPEAVKYVAGRLDTAFRSWLKMSNGTSGGQQGGQQGQGQQNGGQRNGKFTLDDIINDPGVLGSQYKA